MMICGVNFMDWVAKFGMNVASQSSGGPGMPLRDRNKISYLVRQCI